MAGEFDPAIQRLVDDIQKDEETLLSKKRMVNQLCEYAKRPPLYPDAESGQKATVSAIRTDQFYGKPLATAIREYLEMRRASNMGAAAVREIFDALKTGGFKFEAKDETNAMRGLRQSLTKNSVTFHKLPNGSYGLREWYPNVKPAKDNGGEAEDPENESAGDDEPPADSAQSTEASAESKSDDEPLSRAEEEILG